MLVYASTQPFYSPPTSATLANMSLDNYASVLSRGRHDPLACSNTVVLAAGTATSSCCLAAVAAWLVVRTSRARALVDRRARVRPDRDSGPRARRRAARRLPSRAASTIYGTLWILLIAFVTADMPSGMRFAVGAHACRSATSSRSRAYASGASWWQTFRRVLVPLLLPGLVAAGSMSSSSRRGAVERDPPLLSRQ